MGSCPEDLMPSPRFSRREGILCQRTCKPNSVSAEADDDHSSSPDLAVRIQRPTRRFGEPSRFASAEADSLPIWSCSMWGLPCAVCCQAAGALLPHLFTLTAPCGEAVFSLWHFPSLGFETKIPGVTWHIALRSSDFPRALARPRSSGPFATSPLYAIRGGIPRDSGGPVTGKAPAICLLQSWFPA